MVPLQNTRLNITKPKVPNVKNNFWPKFELLWKAKDRILDGHEQKIVKIDNTNICNLQNKIFCHRMKCQWN